MHARAWHRTPARTFNGVCNYSIRRLHSGVEMMQQKQRNIYKVALFLASGINFEGFSLFEVRQDFEVHDERPLFYLPTDLVLLVFL